MATTRGAERFLGFVAWSELRSEAASRARGSLVSNATGPARANERPVNFEPGPLLSVPTSPMVDMEHAPATVAPPCGCRGMFALGLGWSPTGRSTGRKG